MLNLSQLSEQFSNLTPPDRYKAERLIKEISRRGREERSRYFVPSDPSMTTAFGVTANDQLSFYMDESIERWNFSSNRAGKTETAMFDLNQFATGRHPIRSQFKMPPVYIRVCAPSYEDNIKRVILKKLQSLVIREDLRGRCWSKAWSEKEKTLHYANGTSVNFKSFEQDVDKFAGDDLDAVYQDEHGPAKYYRENKARLVDRRGYFVSTMTPEEGGITWEKKHVLARANDGVKYWRWNIFGNPHLSKEGVEEFAKAITDERVRRVKLYGEWVALAGLIYPQFDQKIHLINTPDIPKDWYRVFCIDPHIKKASAMLWAAWSPEGDVIFYRAAKKQLTVTELKQYIRVQSSGEKISLWMGDEAMGGEGLNIWGERSVLEMLRTGENPIPIVGTNQASDKAFEAGVNKVRELLNPEPVSKKPRLFVTRDCMELADEFEEYQFMPESKADEMTYRERVRSIDDDLITCVRYIVMAGSAASETGNGKSAYEGSWS